MDNMRINLIKDVEYARNSLIYENEQLKDIGEYSCDHIVDQYDTMLLKQYELLSKEIEQDIELLKKFKK